MGSGVSQQYCQLNTAIPGTKLAGDHLFEIERSGLGPTDSKIIFHPSSSDSLVKLRQIGIVSFSIKQTALAVGGCADF
jgi:hypothetical protein